MYFFNLIFFLFRLCFNNICQMIYFFLVVLMLGFSISPIFINIFLILFNQILIFFYSSFQNFFFLIKRIIINFNLIYQKIIIHTFSYIFFNSLRELLASSLTFSISLVCSFYILLISSF